MVAQLPERQMHWVRWVLTVGWGLIIASLFYDPWTAALTVPDHPWSPLALSEDCVRVQGQCVEQVPYPLGATLFWGAIVPSGIFILLVFGHELWRRICPLSFLSQIPRALGWQRQFKRQNQATGKVRYELAKVRADSWLGRNFQYLQFGYLFVGLCGRILFFNADRLVLGSWLVFTIGAALAVGYCYGGKSWCQYFCPMAPVQTVFSEPRGLLGSKAHMSEQRITQSMCRTVSPDGQEQSACVACQSPCFDIDSERTYWDGLSNPQESLIRYGYLGLVVGYFVYYYLYAGSWDYYFSGVWNRDPNQLGSLMNPGLYLGGQPINIPKLLAVPLVLGAFTAGGYGVGRVIEHWAKARQQRRFPQASDDLVRHHIFVLCTFAAFNIFFFFAGRPLLRLTPGWVQFGFDGVVLFASTLWLRQSWGRSPARYGRENLASRLRKQLEKLPLDVSPMLGGRSLHDLNADEIYVLAKVLPGFTQEQRHQVYKGVMRDALEEGYVDTASSLDVLQQMRQELGITDTEHRQVLEELGVEDPELLNPNRQRSLENQIRLTGYQQSLERLMRLRQSQPDLTFDPSQQDVAQISSLGGQYAITSQEDAWILGGFSPDLGRIEKAEGLLARLADWAACAQALDNLALGESNPAVTLLQAAVDRKQTLLATAILETLATLADAPKTLALAEALHQLAPPSVLRHLPGEEGQHPFSPAVLAVLTQPPAPGSPTPPKSSIPASASHLEHLLHHYDSIVQSTALYLLAQLDADRAQSSATKLRYAPHPALVRDTAEQLLTLPPAPPLTALPRLEKLVYLANSDFFQGLAPETLMDLGRQATMKAYAAGETITAAGDTCRELLVLIEGEANIHFQAADGPHLEPIQQGKMLDELEVLTHSCLENTIVAARDETRILAIPVDTFDALLDQDPDFARRVLMLESQRMQQFIRL
ncbi:MAG: cyclic nucleotide-binding domain-containing protein [Nodosilinea sp.]